MPIDLFQENPRKRTGKQRPNFEGDSGTKTKLGNREQDLFFFIFGEQGNKPIYFIGNKGTGTHPGKAPGEGSACWSVVY